MLYTLVIIFIIIMYSNTDSLIEYQKESNVEVMKNAAYGVVQRETN